MTRGGQSTHDGTPLKIRVDKRVAAAFLASCPRRDATHTPVPEASPGRGEQRLPQHVKGICMGPSRGGEASGRDRWAAGDERRGRRRGEKDRKKNGREEGRELGRAVALRDAKRTSVDKATNLPRLGMVQARKEESWGEREFSTGCLSGMAPCSSPFSCNHTTAPLEVAQAELCRSVPADRKSVV